MGIRSLAFGGGKGMKVVEDVSQLAEALASAQREAQSSFGDSRMLAKVNPALITSTITAVKN